MMKKWNLLFFSLQMYICLAFALFCACTPATDDLYARYPARFSVQYVSTIPELSAALNGYGEFATILYKNNYFYYSNQKTTTEVPRKATDQGFMMGVSGFIVGRSNMPELGSDQYPIMCYDLACPNCFDADNVAKNLILKDGGFVSCLRCGRTYNLNNQGIISDGEDGLKLYRYRATYSGSSFSIRN